MASRDPADLHPYLRERWPILKEMYEKSHPGNEMILTCTHRSPEEQRSLYAIGRTKPGSKITQIDGVKRLSNHNYKPSRAFDIAILVHGKIPWADDPATPENEMDLWLDAGMLADKIGLVWGGNWPKFKDWPHYELPKDWNAA